MAHHKLHRYEVYLVHKYYAERCPVISYARNEKVESSPAGDDRRVVNRNEHTHGYPVSTQRLIKKGALVQCQFLMYMLG